MRKQEIILIEKRSIFYIFIILAKVILCSFNSAFVHIFFNDSLFEKYFLFKNIFAVV